MRKAQGTRYKAQGRTRDKAQGRPRIQDSRFKALEFFAPSGQRVGRHKARTAVRRTLYAAAQCTTDKI